MLYLIIIDPSSHLYHSVFHCRCSAIYAICCIFITQSIDKRFQHLSQELSAADQFLDELWMEVNRDRDKSRAAMNIDQTEIIYKTLSTIERLIGKCERDSNLLPNTYIMVSKVYL